jgi:predicted nucleic acid-binding protein
MSLMVDVGALYAQADRADPHHLAVVEVLHAERGPLVTSQIAVAEADYLMLTRLGLEVELAFLQDLAAGTFLADCLSRAELGLALEVARRYRDLKLGVSDAALVVLARRHQTRRLLTFDERAFRAVTPLQGGSFTLLPADL